MARATDAADRELVSAVRAGDDAAFEELYRRYSRRVAGYVCSMVGDPDRAEDVTQEAFFSALRRLRRTDTEIVFKPWIFEIAKNASIDHFRRTSRAEEVSIHAEDGGLRPADHLRLVGGSPAPEAVFEGKERLDHLQGAFEELSESHSRILVLRELEGLSYREIGERMDLTRPAVESTLFRARRRLNEEYAEIDTGARCLAVGAAIGRLAEGIDSARDRRRVGRHVARCTACRRQARELGVSVEVPVRTRVAALLPIPALARRRRGATHDGGAGAAGGYTSGVHGVAGTWGPAIVTTGAAEGTANAWGKAVAIVATLALAGGGAAIQDRVVSPDRGVDSPQAAPTTGGAGDDGGAGGGGSTGGHDNGPAGSGSPGSRGGDAGGTGTGQRGGDTALPEAPQVRPGGVDVAPPSFASPSVPAPQGDVPAPPADPEVPDLAVPDSKPDVPEPEGLVPRNSPFGTGTDFLPSLPALPPAPAELPPTAGGAVNPPELPSAPPVQAPAAPQVELPAG